MRPFTALTTSTNSIVILTLVATDIHGRSYFDFRSLFHYFSRAVNVQISSGTMRKMRRCQ